MPHACETAQLCVTTAHIQHYECERWRICARVLVLPEFGAVVALHRLHDDTRATIYGNEARRFCDVLAHCAREGIDNVLSRIVLYSLADAYVIRDINDRN